MLTVSSPFPVNRIDLGPFKRLYLGRRQSQLRRLFQIAGCASLLLLLPGLSGGLGKAAAALMSGILLSIGFFYRSQRNAVAVFTDGIALPSNGRVYAVSWDEIRHYYGAAGLLRLICLDGTELKITPGTSNFGEISRLVQMRCAESIYLRLSDWVGRGGLAEFGPLTISKSGFECSGLKSDWVRLQRVYTRTLDERQMLVFEWNTSTGRGLQLPAEEVPSLEVVYRLVEQLAPARMAMV